MSQGMIAKRYTKLASKRSAYIKRAEACASVTIPSLFPPQGSTGNDDFRTPYQATGAKGLNTLASKLLLTLLPPNQPFFRYTIDSSDLEAISEESFGEVEKVLASVERLTMQDLDRRQPRAVTHETIKQLLCAGNGLLYVGEDNLKLYRLSKYVCKRDAMGNAREMIIEEPIVVDDVPKHMRHLVAELSDEEADRLKIYTQIKLHGNHWVVLQEIKGEIDVKSRSTYPKKKCPYLPLRMIRVDGEDYGRSYVEEYLGDLKSLEVLTKALNEGTTAAAKIIFLRNPNGTTKAKAITKAPNGGFVDGNRDDVHVLQMEKQADFNTARLRMGEIREELSGAFLMNGSLTRQAERVTATEIRAMAQELETVLGGVYSLLSAEFQGPVVEVILASLTRAGKLPTLPEDTLKPQVLTGVAALGRSQELDKLRMLLEALQIFGPEVIAENFEVDEYIKRTAAALSIDTAGLVPTKEQKEAVRQTKKMQQMTDMVKGMPTQGVPQ